MNSEQTTVVYEFGPFRLEQSERRLMCRDRPIPLPGKAGPSGALVDDVEARLMRPGKGAAPRERGLRALITEDTFVIVEVRGQKPLEPVLTGDAAEILPFAMTAPLWIDADGDGRALGR